MNPVRFLIGDDHDAPLEPILCPKELRSGPPRPPDYEKENRALVELAQGFADSPRTIFQALADTLLEVCLAESAGVSLLTTVDGGKRVYWAAIAGRWNPHIGGGMPRDLDPCDVLDRNTPLLFQHIERRCRYFQRVIALLEEALVVPFYFESKAVGTIWAVALKEGRVLDGAECIAERPDGRRVWFTPYPRPLRDAKGRIIGGVNMLLDITERQAVERASGLLAAIVDSSDEVIISMNLDSIITSWNQSAERLFGHKAEEAVGRNVALIVPPDRLEEEATILDGLKRGKHIEHFETVRVRKDGSTFDVSLTISPVKDATGNVIGASRMPRDITQRKEAERTTGLLAAIVDSSDDAIISKSLDGVISSWNKGAERMFGYTADEAIGQHITLIIPPDRQQEEAMILERLKRGERVDHFETVRVRKDGTPLDISLTISPVRDGEGRVIGASKVARDITEQKRAEQALRESKGRLRSLADGLETDVRLRTRELERRNAEVLDQSEQLRDLSNRLLRAQDDERRHIARDLHDSAGQILTALGMSLANIGQHVRHDPQLAKGVEGSQELVQQLSKEIRTTSYLLHPPLLDENGLPEAIRWYVHGLEGRSDLKIELCISDTFGRLPCDVEMALFRVVQECLTNIHRHSGSKKAIIRIVRKAETVSLDIQDEGKGIPAEKLVNMQGQNAGVGISGMRERICHLGGTMTIQSNHTGTTISVTLPIRMNVTSQPESMMQQTRAAG